MTRNLKALGLALAAVLAMCAMAGSAAAAEATFTSGSNWTILSASALSYQVFEIEDGAYKCASASFNASMGTDQSEITVELSYGKTAKSKGFTEAETNGTECEIVINGTPFKATIDNNGCHYVFAAGGKTDGSTQITCPAGKEIEVRIDFFGEFRPCFEIPAQTPAAPTVDYTNGTYVSGGVNRWDVTFKSTVQGIEYTSTGLCGSGTFGDTAVTGEITVKGHNTANEQVDFTWDPEN